MLHIRKIFVYLQRKLKSIQIMTAVELRSSIAADLDRMSVEMLEHVSRYVRRMRRRENMRVVGTREEKMKAAIQFVESLSVTGGQPVPDDERGVGALIDEKYGKR